MNRKLKAWQVVRIRELATRGETQERLAEMYNVGLMTISDVVLKKTWVDAEAGFEREEPFLQTVRDDKSLDNMVDRRKKALGNLIRRWIACRNAVADQRAGALAFNYQPQDIVLVRKRERFDISNGKQRRASSRIKVVVRLPADYYNVTIPGPASHSHSEFEGRNDTVTARKPRRFIKSLPSDRLCWALTFEIVLRDELYTSERWAIARWYKDERNTAPFPQRAAEKLVRECRRRGLIY